VSAASLLTLRAMQPCGEPHGIGTTRPDHSASSAVDRRQPHGKQQQAAGTHRPGGCFCLKTVPFGKVGFSLLVSFFLA